MRRIFSRSTEVLLVCLSALLTTAAVDWRSITSGFSVLPGDRYDAMIATTILEHWYNTIIGRDIWTEVGYFYPYQNTIAQTDAYFLVGLLYFPFRAAGLDIFVSTHMAGLTLKAVGFIGMFVFGRFIGRWPTVWALAAAVIFTFSSGMTAHSSRIQLATVALAPIMLTLLCVFVVSLQHDMRRSTLVGVAAGLLFGAWCLTCFYMAWFFAFFCLALTLVLLATDWKGTSTFIIAAVQKKLLSIVVTAAAFAFSVAPFAIVFLPKSMEAGTRSYGQVTAYLPTLESVLQVGANHYLFGQLYAEALAIVSPSYVPTGEYHNTGFNLFIFFVFAAGGFALFSRRLGEHQVFWRAGWLATASTWLLTMSWGGVSAWWIVFHVVPGAKALQVVLAYQIFLAFPVIALAFHRLVNTHWADCWPPVFIVGGLLLAELNQPYLNLHREAERTRIAHISAPPAACEAFYVSAWPNQYDPAGSPSSAIDAIYGHNVSAMLLAQLFGVPTVNGFASFNPPGWDLALPLDPGYEERVMSYAQSHGVTAGLCKLDLGTGLWSDSDSSQVVHARTDT